MLPTLLPSEATLSTTVVGLVLSVAGLPTGGTGFLSSSAASLMVVGGLVLPLAGLPSAGESEVVRVEAGALVLTGKSAVVRPEPAHIAAAIDGKLMLQVNSQLARRGLQPRCNALQFNCPYNKQQ